MNATNKYRGPGQHDPIYVCSSKRELFRHRDLVDAPVIATVAAMLDAEADELRAYAAPPTSGDEDMGAELDRLTAKLAGLDAALDADEIDVADYSRATRRARARVDEITARRARAAGRPALAALLASADPAAAWADLVAAADPEPARIVLRELVERVVVLTPAVPRRPSVGDVRFEGGRFPS